MTSIFVKGTIKLTYKDKPKHLSPIGGKTLGQSPPDDVL